MQHNKSELETKTTKAMEKLEIKGKRFGRGAVDSGLTHECGVFGVVGTGKWPTNVDIAQTVCLGLVALQHRGQESAGIVTSEGNDSKNFNIHKGMGMINNIFTDESIKKLKGNLGIGHTRYSTSAASEEVNCQPFVVHTAQGPIALAHNGELVNCESLRTAVLGRGVGLSTHSDSELITQSLCVNPPDGEINGPDWPARIKHLMKLTKISYSLVIMMKDKIYGVRDPYGNRPLCIGRIVPLKSRESSKNSGITNGNSFINGNGYHNHMNDDDTDGWVISSESCGFLSIGARYEREVEPGEIVELTQDGVRTIDIVERPRDESNRILPQAFCIFEYVYFARSDSIFEGQMVYTVRMECGRQLAIEAPVEADIVSSVPESGTAAAHGFSRESKIAFVEVLCKNRYVGRTFIQPSTRLRQLGVAKKFGALSENVAGKRLILIDDSIVRGNTIGPIIKLLRDAGAKEVHIRIASPPLLYPCYMGINIPTKQELIGNHMNPQELAKHVGADSLAYLSVDGLIRAVRTNLKSKNKSKVGHCTACLTGKYPVELDYSLVIMMKDKIYGVRDPYGNRPLCIGRIVPLKSRESSKNSGITNGNSFINGNGYHNHMNDDDTDGWVISSESCGFLSIGARYEREVEPGEIVELTQDGVRTIDIVERPRDESNRILPQAFCIFEYVYFARSDSIFEGQMVYTVRMECGRQLAIEAPVEADIVSSVPESGTAAAHGFSRESKIAFVEVLCKNRYVGRTFIQPSTRLRQLGVAKKFGALSENVAGKRLILIDDSIVRGNTIGPIIKLLRDAGAKEVHIRIASPPLLYPCYMGINIPTKQELIGNHMNPQELAKHVGADSLAYLSVDGLIRAVRTNLKSKNKSKVGHCTACLTGKYPVELEF
ncbi:CLUMA_CG003246, isoform A [Clunio marinus]|uniref:Amidophosphoribosyltransferase n=1 Tax=Clunio marinus TaxID=568069 RepID=A0A1J1HNG7_9DIPT|nr:CLUMA_CG003246, isoform A [Clunio marinus]